MLSLDTGDSSLEPSFRDGWALRTKGEVCREGEDRLKLAGRKGEIRG